MGWFGKKRDEDDDEYEDVDDEELEDEDDEEYEDDDEEYEDDEDEYEEEEDEDEDDHHERPLKHKNPTAREALSNPMLVLSALACCLTFPLGIFLVWRHPTWPKAVKLLLIGGWLVVAGGLTISIIQTRSSVNTALAEGDALWKAGKHEEAERLYYTKVLPRDRVNEAPKDQLPLVFKRVIESLAKRGETTMLRMTIQDALRMNVKPDLEDPRAIAAWDDYIANPARRGGQPPR